MGRFIAVFLCSFSVYLGLLTPILASAPYAPGEIMIKFKTNAHQASLMQASLHNFLGARVLQTFASLEGLQHVQIPTDDVSEAVAIYQSHPLVEYAEPNYIYFINRFEDFRDLPLGDTPTDVRFDELWGLHNVGQDDSKGQSGFKDADIDMVEAWETTQGSKDVIVAIVDTGVDYTHEDLSANIWVNTNEIADNEIDDDENGYVDDIHGWDAYNNDGDPKDDHSHGTHVAGTIGAVGNNDIGVIGVAPNVTLMAVKFLGSTGSGKLSDAVIAIDYAVKMGANMLNNSWGGGGFSQTLYDAIENAANNNVTFLAAAGNSAVNNDYGKHYPSSYELDNVIAVSATTNRDELASFSSYGFRTVHVAAPGNNILSSVMNNQYKVYSGTSMATPHVSGLSALILSQNPDFTPAQIRDRLISTSDEAFYLKRKIAAGGRVNAYNALNNIIPPKRGPIDPGDWQDQEKAISTPHSYKSNSFEKWTITHEGATYLKVHFKKLHTEEGYDVVKIKDKAGNLVDLVDGKFDDLWSFIVLGDSMTIEFESDATVNNYGFDIDKYAFSRRPE